MRLISYARNLEDVMLWRALRHLEHGFYIDVGAGWPDADSVTRAFYERGWHGVNVEPARAQHRALLVARPADINLQWVAGTHTGSADFFDIEGSAASTVDPDRARAASSAGATVVRRELPCHTLTGICERHASGAIHFLKIDTAGGEAALLDSLDLTRFRPWIIVLAGAAPEARMAASGYAAAHHDGVNTYYLAREHAQLAEALAVPPSEADQFHLREDHPYAYPLSGWRDRVAQLEENVRLAEQRADEARSWAEARVREREELADARLRERDEAAAARDAAAAAREATLEQALAGARAETAAQQARADYTDSVLHERTAEYHAVLSSASWRLTEPMRQASARLRRMRTRLRHLLWCIRHGIAQGRQRLRTALAGAVKRAAREVRARPKLFFFIRHHLGRHPRLVNWLRRQVQRTQAPAAAPVATGTEDLSSTARGVLADLRRALDRQRPH